MLLEFISNTTIVIEDGSIKPNDSLKHIIFKTTFLESTRHIYELKSRKTKFRFQQELLKCKPSVSV